MVENHNKKEERQIGLALSGGGVRAISFHAGVLKWFAEREMLSQIEHISSVSGGSLLIGLIFSNSGYTWPNSKRYKDDILPKIKQLLTKESLQVSALLNLILYPPNWRFMLSRANVLANSIEKLWGISAKLKDLPLKPVWTINGTTAENGRRFRFKNGTAGDYEIGYADAGDFKIADAMAMSAAFPGLIGPLSLKVKPYEWYKRKEWDSKYPPDLVVPKFKRLHLYDGGVYDNLGLEPIFDCGKQVIKYGREPKLDFIVVSDAGTPYSRNVIPGPLHYKRLLRIADIGFDQARALRVRSYVNFLQNNCNDGMYLQIGSNPMEKIKQYSLSLKSNDETGWLSQQNVSTAITYSTDLKKMKENDFDLICEHGYQTAKWNELFLNRD